MENNIITILGAIVAAVNAAFLIYTGWKKLKPEVKKMDVEVDSEIVESANLNLEGSKTSINMLLDRVNELKSELDKERKARIEDMDRVEKVRKDDAEYFRRRIKDLERESRDYRSWAAKLVKQVVEAGKVPVPFVPSFGDSDANLTAIRTDLENDPNK